MHVGIETPPLDIISGKEGDIDVSREKERTEKSEGVCEQAAQSYTKKNDNRESHIQ